MRRLPEEYISPAAVLVHHAVVKEALILGAGRGFTGVANRDVPLDRTLAEHERRSVLAFVASIEALFRHDLRNPGRPKGELRRGFRKLRRDAAAAGRRGVPWDRLMAYRAGLVSAEARGAFGQYVEIVRYRNWLAHGRNYRPRNQFAALDLEAVTAVAVRMLRAITARPDLKVALYQQVLEAIVEE